MRQKKVNICIVGAAASGLTAAVRAYENGLRDIVVLEKNRVAGGCTRMGWGMFGVESAAEKRLGCTETADQLYNFHMERSNFLCDGRLARLWITSCGKVLDWIESLGVRFDEVHACSGEFRTYHTSGAIGVEAGEKTGNQIVKKLLGKCEEYGIPVLTSTKGKHLIQDETGRVVGIQAEDPEGELEIRANSVVMATGSISANTELLKRFYPDKYWGDEIWVTPRALFSKDNEVSSGDGLKMVEEIGVGVGDYFTVLNIGPMVPCNKNANYFVKMPEILKVNRNGERFVREDYNVVGNWGWMQGNALDRQPGRVCYAIVDATTIPAIAGGAERTSFHEKQAAMEYLRLHKRQLPAEDQDNKLAWIKYVEKDLQQVIAKGEAVRVDTLEEAAAFIGCKADTLRKSVESYNRNCKEGYDAEFLKDPKYMLPQETAPYYIIRCWAAVDTVIGGIRIDSRMRVIDRNRNVVPGLYGVGVSSGGWGAINTYSFWGSCMSWSFTSGYLVPETILEDMKDN